MKGMRKLAIAVIFVGLAGLFIGILEKLIYFSIGGFSPRGWGDFATICLVLSLNLLLLEKKS